MISSVTIGLILCEISKVRSEYSRAQLVHIYIYIYTILEIYIFCFSEIECGTRTEKAY